MTEPEARRLGLPIRSAAGTVSGSSGQRVQGRYVVVRDLAVGSMRFRNVSFLVLPADGPFGGEMTGIVGMPVLLALGTIRWQRDGTVELAGKSDRRPLDRPNLVFFRNHLLVRAEVRSRAVFAAFDTGAETTDLNANFADEFADFVERTGVRTTQPISGVGGTANFDAIRLPEVVVTVGDSDVPLRPAVMSMQRISGLGGDCCVANLGKDLLVRGRGFTIDFSTMMLTIDSGGSP
jgi:predicted aspartyl protease